MTEGPLSRAAQSATIPTGNPIGQQARDRPVLGLAMATCPAPPIRFRLKRRVEGGRANVLFAGLGPVQCSICGRRPTYGTNMDRPEVLPEEVLRVLVREVAGMPKHVGHPGQTPGHR